MSAARREWPDIADANRSEREEALRKAAAVLMARYPHHTQAPLLVGIGPNLLEAHAVFLWPGIVRVTVRYSGELIAQSRPGNPHTLDVRATA